MRHFCHAQIVLLACLLPLIMPGRAQAQETLPATPWKALSLSTAATHFLLALERPPAAIDQYGQIADPSQKLPVIGKGTVISREKLAELQINFVLHWSYQTDVAQWCQQLGLRSESIEPLRLPQIPQLIERLGKLFDAQDEALKLRKDFQRQLAAVVANSAAATGSPTTVYFELYSPGKIAGDETYVGDLIRAAGGRSLARQSGLVSIEAVLEAAPEVIFYVEGFATSEDIRRRPGLKATPAARQGRIVPVPRRLLVEGLAPVEAIKYLQSHLR